ncbi:hypothetical protein [Clostridium oceanicum]
MAKFLKNEITKLVHSKKLYILIGFIIFMAISICFIMNSQEARLESNPKEALEYSKEMLNDLLNMNSSIFLKQLGTEFIFRTAAPYFAFFMIVFSIGIFGEDFFSGNMKFFIRLHKDNSSIFKAKVLSLIVYSFLVVVLTLLLGFIVGIFFFGLSFKGLSQVILIYLSAIIPMASWGLIFGLVSMYIKNKNVSIALGIAVSIFLSISDKTTITNNFSPIGVIGYVGRVRFDGVDFKTLIIGNLVALIYFVVAYFIGKNIFEKREFSY